MVRGKAGERVQALQAAHRVVGQNGGRLLKESEEGQVRPEEAGGSKGAGIQDPSYV